MSLNRNIPGWERLVRLVVGLGIAVFGGFWAAGPQAVAGWVVIASGLGLGATGLVGWCPACAAVGRTLPEAKQTVKIARL